MKTSFAEPGIGSRAGRGAIFKKRATARNYLAGYRRALFAGRISDDVTQLVNACRCRRACKNVAKLSRTGELPLWSPKPHRSGPIKGREALWQMRVNRQYRVRFVVVRDIPLEVEDVWFGDPH